MNPSIAYGDDGKLIEACDFDFEQIEGYDIAKLPEAELIEAFKRLMEWAVQVPKRDFRGIAIRVQTIRAILTQRDQTEMAREIGVTKAAMSQRICELHDTLNIPRPTKANLRSKEIRQKFSIECTQRHQAKKSSQNSATSQLTSTTNSGTAQISPSKRTGRPLPLFKRLYEQARSSYEPNPLSVMAIGRNGSPTIAQTSATSPLNAG